MILLIPSGGSLMTPLSDSSLELEFHPLTTERWDDFEELFGENGACGGCWCMWFRQTRSEFEKNKGEGNRRAMKAIVESGRVPGILAYIKETGRIPQGSAREGRDAEPEAISPGNSSAGTAPERDERFGSLTRAIGWCSVEPRERFPRLETSRVLSPVDDQPVWSIVCFFIDKEYRLRGVSVELMKAAVEYAALKGAKIVEGYAAEPKKAKVPDLYVFHGHVSAYRQAGFKEVARRSPTRPIMRYVI